MTKIKILLILIIVGIVFVSAYVFYQFVLFPQTLLKEVITHSVVDSKKSIETISEKDISICEKMSIQGAKEKCYSEVAQDPSVCEKIIQEKAFRDDCYKRVAIEKEDISLCDKIVSTEIVRDFCYKEVATKKKDISICEQIEDQGMRENCLFLVKQK